MSQPVLILGTEPRVAVSAARSLGRHGLTVDVAALRADEQPLRSRWIRSTLPLASRTSRSQEDLTAQLLSAIERNGYDHMVVTSDSGLRLLTACFDKLPQQLKRSIPAPALVSAVLDKSVTVRIAAEVGLSVPTTWKIPDKAALHDSEAALRFPMVAKPLDKRLGEPFKVRYFRNFQDLLASYDANADFGRNLLFQEFLPGEGVGVEVLMHEGQPVICFQHRRVRELPWAGGVSVVAISEAVDPGLLDQSVRLLQIMGADGLCMVEYRQDKANGRAVFMEVNARAYGSLSLSELSGVEFPWYHWQLLHDRNPDLPTAYRAGLRWRWSAGVLLRLDTLRKPGPPWEARPSLVRELLGACRDFLPPTRDALWSWQDPRPAISEIGAALAHTAKRRAKAVLRVLLPQHLAHRIQRYRNHPPAVRLWLRRKRLARMLGHWKPERQLSPDALQTILFVCHGNIFRSPMCEYLLRRQEGNRQGAPRTVLSAGLRANPGSAAHPEGRKVALEYGLDLSGHRAQPVSEDLLNTADLVVVMDFINEAELLARFPSAASKTVVIGDLVPGFGGIEVPDPYGKGIDSVRECYRDLHQRIAALGEWLERSNMKAA